MRSTIFRAVVLVAVSGLVVAGCSSTASTNNSVTNRSAGAQTTPAGQVSNPAELTALLKTSDVNCKSGDTEWEKRAGSPLFKPSEVDEPSNLAWPGWSARGTGPRAVGFQMDSASRLFNTKGELIDPRPEMHGSATCGVSGGGPHFTLSQLQEISVLHPSRSKTDCVMTQSAQDNKLVVAPCEEVTSNAKQRLDIRFNGRKLMVGEACAETPTDSDPRFVVASGKNCWQGELQGEPPDEHLVGPGGFCLFVNAPKTNGRPTLRAPNLSSSGKYCNGNIFSFGKYAVLNSDFTSAATFQTGDLGTAPAVALSAASPPRCDTGGKALPFACIARQVFPAQADGQLRTALASATLWNLPVQLSVVNQAGSPMAVSTSYATHEKFDSGKLNSAKVGSQTTGAKLMGQATQAILNQDDSTSPTFARLIDSGNPVKVSDSTVTLRIATTSGDTDAAKACSGAGAFTATVHGAECGYIDVQVKIPGGVAGKDTVSSIDWGCRVGGIVDGILDKRFVELSLAKQKPGNPTSLAAGGFLPLQITVRDTASEDESSRTCNSVKRERGTFSQFTQDLEPGSR